MCSDSFDTGQTIPDINKLYWSRTDHGWQCVLRTVTGSWNCVLVAPNLSGYKQSHLAAAPVTLYPHQPPPSLSCNLCQLSRGRSMGVKTWQELSMPPLSSDQRGFNRSERAWDSSMLRQRMGIGSQQLPLSASHGYLYPPAPYFNS